MGEKPAAEPDRALIHVSTLLRSHRRDEAMDQLLAIAGRSNLPYEWSTRLIELSQQLAHLLSTLDQAEKLLAAGNREGARAKLGEAKIIESTMRAGPALTVAYTGPNTGGSLEPWAEFIMPAIRELLDATQSRILR